jgi:hypothetical protein
VRRGSFHHRRAPRQELLALALMLGALVALIAALAGRADPPPRGVVVVLDNSASMNAMAGDTRRFDRATQALAAALEARPDAPVTLISTAPVQVVADHRIGRSALLDRAQSLTAAGDDGPLGPLLTQICEGPRPPELIALGDTSLPSDLACPQTRPSLGGPIRNRGIARMRLRAVDGLGLVEAWIEVQATEPGPVELVLSVGESEIGQVTLEVETTAEARFRLMARSGRAITARLVGADDWADDDVVVATVPPVRRVLAHLLTDAPRGYMAAALGAHPLVDLTVGGVSEAPPAEVDLLVVEVVPEVPLPERSHTVVLGVDLPGAPLGLALADLGGFEWSETDPLLRHVQLERLHVSKARAVPIPAGGTVLGWGVAGPLMVRSTASDGSDTVTTGFAVADSDLGLRVGMANWVANLVLWAQSSDAAPGGAPQGVLSGAQTIAQPLPPQVAAETDGTSNPVAAAAGLAGVFLLIELFLPVMSGREP